MKRKYYMRGLGIGVIVTAILFTIALPKEKPVMTDEEVIARAQKLGYTKEANNITADDINKLKEQEKLTATQGITQATTPEPTGTPGPTPSPAPTPEPPTPPEQPDVPSSPTSVAEQGKPTATAAPTPTLSPKPTATVLPAVTKAPTQAPAKVPDGVSTIKVERGMTATKVARLLQSTGVIDDSGDFVAYLQKEKLTDFINIGTFSIPQGATYEEIATILTK